MYLFAEIGIETMASCNRRCPTCLRNSSPEEGISSWFSDKKLPIEIIEKVAKELGGVGYYKTIWLQHFNEPLLDGRLPIIAELIKKNVSLARLLVNTNGDLLTKEIALNLDGLFDTMYVSCYSSEEVAKQKYLEFKDVFKKTKLMCRRVVHTTTHFSPNKNLNEKIQENKENACTSIRGKTIIDHLGNMLLCCEDMPPHFDLGNVYNDSIITLWTSKKHVEILETLSARGGRFKYPFCSICPREK